MNIDGLDYTRSESRSCCLSMDERYSRWLTMQSACPTVRSVSDAPGPSLPSWTECSPRARMWRDMSASSGISSPS